MIEQQNEEVEYRQKFGYPILQRNGMGIAGFVLAVLSAVLIWVPILNVVLWLLGLVLSVLGYIKPNSRRGLALAGLIITLAEAAIAGILIGYFVIAISFSH